MNKNRNTSMGKMQKAGLVRTIIPMLIMGIVIAIATYIGYEASIKNEVSNSLFAVASSVAGVYDEAYPGDYIMVGEQIISLYKGNSELTGKYEIIDRVKRETGMDVSLIYGNTRILTTLKDEYGSRYIPSGINAAAYSAVQSTDKPLFYEVLINDVNFYACYLPLRNQDDTYAGAIAVAKPVSEITKEAVEAALPVIVITVLAVLFAGIVSSRYTNGLVNSIGGICSFLKAMTDGDLSNDMPKNVLNRNDELAEAGKAVVDMQNAIRVLVERDPLTNLYNRRSGGMKLRKAQKHAYKCGMPYSLAIGDIDFFKRVNDTYGHDAGDEILKAVADIMRKHMVGKGFVARWGGEEFLLVFDKMDQEGAERELNSLLNTVRKNVLVYKDVQIKITMTYGVIDGSVSDDYATLLRLADERLYFGKTNGRNRVVASDEEMRSTENGANVIAAGKKDTESLLATDDIGAILENRDGEGIKPEIRYGMEIKNEIERGTCENVANADKLDTVAYEDAVIEADKQEAEYESIMESEYLRELVKRMSEKIFNDSAD